MVRRLSFAMDVIPNPPSVSVAQQNLDFSSCISNVAVCARKKAAMEEHKQTKHIFEQNFPVKYYGDDHNISLEAKRVRNESRDKKSFSWSTGDLTKLARLKRTRSVSGIEYASSTDIFKR